MENATKALLMAGGVLIGLMIISLAVSLYSSLRGYVEEMNEELSSTEMVQFNEKYLKYINCNDEGEIQFKLTIQDVVTAANTAFENNRQDGYYVKIYLEGTSIETTINNNASMLLQEGLEKEYKCKRENVKIDTKTGRVCQVIFDEI